MHFSISSLAISPGIYQLFYWSWQNHIFVIIIRHVPKSKYKNTYWTANSLVGVRMRTLIACRRFGRNNNLSKVGSANAAVCIER